jgi:hypothetical protein
MNPTTVLGREYSVEILRATGEPTSATHLSESLDIPVATCYRRIRDLVAAGLLEEYVEEAAGSRRASLYRRTTDAVGVRFDSPLLFTWSNVGHAGSIGEFSLEDPEIRAGNQRPATPEAVGDRAPTEIGDGQVEKDV